MNLCVVDDFLTDDWAIEVRNSLLSARYALFDYTVHPNQRKQFSGNLAGKIDESPLFVYPIMYKNEPPPNESLSYIPYLFAGAIAAKTGMKTSGILRFKANINFPSTGGAQDTFYSPHIDNPEYLGQEDTVTALYYVDDSSGDTLFFGSDQENNLVEAYRVSPKKNRLVYFDGAILHAGSPPLSGVRTVLNMDFLATFKQPKNEV